MKDYRQLKRNQKKDLSSYPSVKVALLGDSATQMLATALRGEGVERGYHIELWEAEYNQVERQVMDPTSHLHTQEAKYVIVFQSTHKLMQQHAQLDTQGQQHLADQRIEFVRHLCQHTNGHIIYYNYPEIDDTVSGSYANKLESSFVYQTRKLNYLLMQLATEEKNLFICDIASIQNQLGRNKMFDPAIYVSTELLLSIEALPHIASRTLDIICAIEGKAKKCLILDLDNTLWGGIVGDDGWEKLQIGHGLGIGKAFTELQLWLKKLKERGIILAVCSKNDEEKAKEPFVKNPEMVLRLDDIAVFMANWENKVDNIRTIQETLNIGFDTMVFLDDNPFERNMVSTHLPAITVPELPDDPACWLEYLYGLNLFETASYSREDEQRTRQYQMQAQRASAARMFTDESDFLKSLNMVSEVSSFTPFNTPRVAQLSQRSNQFNLRTIRYTEAQVVAIEEDENMIPFSFTLADRFGDNGLIGVIILQKQDVETLFIHTWFMSCRVLKRGMEDFMLNTIVAHAQQNGYTRLTAEYLPTPKNSMVANLYERLGFTPLPQSATQQYELNVASYRPHPCYITQKQNGKN